MAKYIFRQLKRSIVHNAAFCLLLALAGTLLCLGAGLLLTAVSSAREADEAFTIIALPDIDAIARHADNYVRENVTELDTSTGDVITPEHPYFYAFAAIIRQEELVKTITEEIIASDEFDMGESRVFGGYVPGAVPHIYPPKDMTVLGWPTLRSANTAAAFTAIAESVRYEYYPASTPATGDPDEYVNYTHEVAVFTFTVEETLLLHPALSSVSAGAFKISAPVESFDFRLVARNADGTPMIEVGKRYFIYGRGFRRLIDYYSANGASPFPQMSPPGTMYPNTSTGHPYDFSWLKLQPSSVLNSISDIDVNNRQLFTGMSVDEWPITTYTRVWDDPFYDPFLEFTRFNTGFRWLIELPDDPNEPIPDALQSEIDEIVEMGKRSAYAVAVVTTNELDSYFQFNQGIARVVEGRSFTDYDIETGAKVVLVNERTEGIAVGDIINLQLYDTTVNPVVNALAPHSVLWTIEQPYSPVSLTAEPLEFEVIGLYFAPEDDSAHAVPPNAIFIPDNSVAEYPFIVPEISDDKLSYIHAIGMTLDEWLTKSPRAYGYIPFFDTIIIPNGENEAFADAVNAIVPEFSAFFKIYDQGYSNVKSAIDNLQSGGMLIIVLCFIGWLVAIMVFCLFYILRKRKDAGLLFALGIKKKHRFRWLFAQCLIVIILSQVIAFGAASLLYGGTVDYAITAAERAAPERPADFSDAVMAQDGAEIEFAVRRNPYAIPLAAAGQFVVLLLISGGMSAAIVKKGVTSLKGGDV